MPRCTVGDKLTNEPFGVLYALPTVLELNNPVKWVPYNATSHSQAIAYASRTNCKTFPMLQSYKAHFHLDFATAEAWLCLYGMHCGLHDFCVAGILSF